MTGQMIDEVKSMWKILPPAAVPRELLVETDKAWVHDCIIMHAVIATIDPDACNSLAFESDTQQTRCRLITLSKSAACKLFIRALQYLAIATQKKHAAKTKWRLRNTQNFLLNRKHTQKQLA